MAQRPELRDGVANTFLLTLVVVPLQLAPGARHGDDGAEARTRPRPRAVGLTIPLGVSDLAAGLAWLAILQNSGYLNSLALRARR